MSCISLKDTQFQDPTLSLPPQVLMVAILVFWW